MHRSKVDLSALSILNADGEKVSYLHIYNLCVTMIRDGRMASDALQVVYRQLIHHSHLVFAGHNSADYPTYRDKSDYKELSRVLSPKLRRLVRAKRYVEEGEVYFLQAVDPELCRGVDIDQLLDIGILTASRANVST